MTWSMNEVEALARKAARGAGFGWGHAEDAGRATRWLCQHGLDGSAALARYLDALSGDLACPIRLGAALSDSRPDETKVELGTLAEPLLVLPFVADVARASQTDWVLRSATGWACLGPDGGARMSGELGGPLTLIRDQAQGDVLPPVRRAVVTEAAAQILQRFAARTYAPATEESRLAGAGAGVSDND